MSDKTTEKQLTLRTPESVVERLKMAAKQEKLPVNTLLNIYVEEGIARNAEISEYAKIATQPINTLSKIYSRYVQYTGDVNLSPLELRYLTAGVEGALNNTNNNIVGHYQYADMLIQAARQSETNAVDRGAFEVLFPFAMRHFLTTAEERQRFATLNASAFIRTARYEITAGKIAFSALIEGTERNRFAQPEERIAPLFILLCTGENFQMRINLDKFVALVRVLKGFNKEQMFYSLNAVKLMPVQGKNQWLMLIGELQLTLSGSDLNEMISWFEHFMQSGFLPVMNELLMLFGDE